MGIEVVSNSPADPRLDEDLVVPVTLLPLVYRLPSGTYSVKVTTFALDWFPRGDPASVTTATATFALTHVSAAKLSLVRKVSEYQTHGWKITGALKKNGRSWPRAKVAMQVKISPLGWKTLLSKTTGRNGQVTFTSNPDRGSGRWPARLMAVGPDGETVVSKTFPLYRR